jgi:hypothetical protein
VGCPGLSQQRLLLAVDLTVVVLLVLDRWDVAGGAVKPVVVGVVDIADAQSELQSDPMEPLRRWSGLADARKLLSTGRGRLHHSSVKVAVWWDRERGPGRPRRSACSSPLESALGFDPRLPAGGEARRLRGAPRYQSVSTRTGRERLVFIDGEVPVAPYPDWSQSDTALASIARLLRGLHDAARRFDPQGLTWDDALVDPAGGTLACHHEPFGDEPAKGEREVSGSPSSLGVPTHADDS